MNFSSDPHKAKIVGRRYATRFYLETVRRGKPLEPTNANIAEILQSTFHRRPDWCDALRRELALRYVEASRARQGTNWYVSRQDLGLEGHDTDRINRLAEQMRNSHAQTPSLAHPELPDIDYGPGYTPTLPPSRQRPIPGLARALHRLTQPPDRAQERTR